ncbi:sirohydrochlorin cobaltochelatase [Clostridium omnivorum]|uniref:Sirohydrochlorin cobaltochelatase n=1 Tax=Clostridium omnivorum TaxID=1604902 RepID=A0ABQ5NBA6_9CLOT|nr:sirohydrochlorin cobaltochelatase [Clostridium sp. E14]GLC32471.1 sirohydrochlorin cobaltochelatase [Clostridium sp. E14]
MKKAILVVSFGTTHKDTLKLTIEKIEDRIKRTFPEYEMRRAFTAHMIIKILKDRDGIVTDTPEEALEKLKLEGFEEVIVQPLHIIPGAEFDYIKLVVDEYKRKGVFKKISLGRPALYFQAVEEELPDDYKIFVEAIDEVIPKDKAAVFMGHGSSHPANACYGCLQSVLSDLDKEKIYIGTVEGYPTIETIIRRLKKDNVKEVVLVPLMLVAGDHAKNDMASDEEDSWKSILEVEGINSEVYLHGLGEIEKFQDIYLKHIKDVIEGKYINFGETRKGRRY